VIDPRHRARDYPGSQRLRVRAAGAEAHEVAYVAVPAGAEAEALARAEYLRERGLEAGKVQRVVVTALPD
jgi:hypothetical protein